MYGTSSKRRAANVLGVLAIAVGVAGCELGAASAGMQKQESVEPVSRTRQPIFEKIPAGWYQGEHAILRSRMDVERGRYWILTTDGLEVYEIESSKKLAQIQLPDWIWVRAAFSCSPDLVLGPKGEAVVSSNVVPTLWRIDPVTLATSKHELVLDEDTGRDVGFTGLAYSPEQGAFFAVSPSHGALWRIDPLLRRAQSISLSAPVPKACGLAMRNRAPEQRASRFVGLCVGTDRGDWSVSLSPDQRSGHVSPRQCTG